ncbi:Xaa-Pro aminopeptidase [Oceanibacterium hippocampi]|uniref:Xaa-Pro aminopeptidase n=2 Tax=Oceanibacterium hippocampi TaxID=745714 RepID=A0A1Y5TX32_9PROT|nr:Xaa-Pro aminopeptidase [Oceanibacterium hippocampi]
MIPVLHFERTELAARQDATCRAMRAQGLDALLLFRQESLFYLTGFDTFGYVYFQCIVLTADGSMTLLTRAPDLRQARHTSVIEDIRIWEDRAGSDPAGALQAILAEKGLKGARVGIELEAYGLTGRNWEAVRTRLDGFCRLEDASDLVSRLRLVKSPAEIAYVRRAAELADRAYDRAVELAAPGADEGTILAAMQGAVFEGGGDYPGNEFIIGSGEGALLCRYFTGRRKLDPKDQLTLEWAGVYRRYHAAMMRTVLVGKASQRQRDMHAACAEALEACEAALRPGRPIGEVFDAHARVLDGRGYRAHRLNACGYAMGTTFAPNWMDWPMFYTGNPEPAAPGMAFFLHMILMDSDHGEAMTLGHSVLVTESGTERLSRSSLELVVA